MRMNCPSTASSQQPCRHRAASASLGREKAQVQRQQFATPSAAEAARQAPAGAAAPQSGGQAVRRAGG